MWWLSGYVLMGKHLLRLYRSYVRTLILSIYCTLLKFPTIMVARQPENYADYVNSYTKLVSVAAK